MNEVDIQLAITRNDFMSRYADQFDQIEGKLRQLQEANNVIIGDINQPFDLIHVKEEDLEVSEK